MVGGKDQEAPLDSKRRIIDAHHHLWDHGATSKYLVDDLLGDTRSGHNVTNTVFVECRSSFRRTGPRPLKPVGETEFVARQSLASEGRGTTISAIVAFADLRLGDAVEEVLNAHEAAGQGRFRGIRHSTTWDADPNIRLGAKDDPDLMAKDEFRRGVVCVGKNGYSFDAWVYHPQLLQLVDLAQASEGTTIVVDHLGGPLGVGRYTNRNEVRSDWRAGMATLAACSNTVLKLGGIGMDYKFGTGWSARGRPPDSDEVVRWWGDDIRWCVDTFGPGRCMFESNFPVDRQSMGYTVLWNAFQKIAAGYTDEEQAALFAGTAARVYRIT
jgi:predicted TIM-barrel fold metal-dependent hydrolase